jgi:hypothetical protein
MDQNTLTPEEQTFFDTMGEADKGASAGAETVVDPGTQGQPAADGQQPDAGAGQQQQTDGAQPGQQKMVPHAALHQSREETKEAKARAAAAEERANRLEQRTNLILERMMQQGQPTGQPTAPKEEPLPEVDKDPVGFIVGSIKKLSEEINGLKTVDQNRQQQGQQATVAQQVSARAAAMENQFVAQAPDYWDASSFLRQTRHQEYEAMGYTDPVQREQIIANEAFQIAAMALQQGRNPAEVVYQLAGRRGYQKKGAPAANGNGQQQQPNGQQGNGAQQLERIGNGQQQNASLTKVTGTAPRPMTAQRLFEMSDAEFAKAVEDPRNLALLGE